MIYIGTQADNGCAIYLDVHAMERCRRGVELSAVIGDGSYEGELLLGIGNGVEITFIDALWGDAQGLKAFLERHGEDKIRSDLRRAVAERFPGALPCGGGRGMRPHVYLPLFDGHGVVAEALAAAR